MRAASQMRLGAPSESGWSPQSGTDFGAFWTTVGLRALFASVVAGQRHIARQMSKYSSHYSHTYGRCWQLLAIAG
jgi:hypothetical protein